MSKKLVLFLAMMFTLSYSFANESELVEEEIQTNNFIVSCNFSESGSLSCGMGYSIPCASSRAELDEIYAELNCLGCNVGCPVNPPPGN